jgi:hypothetical protein
MLMKTRAFRSEGLKLHLCAKNALAPPGLGNFEDSTLLSNLECVHKTDFHDVLRRRIQDYYASSINVFSMDYDFHDVLRRRIQDYYASSINVFSMDYDFHDVFVTLWLCVRGNGIIHRAHQAIQGDECCPRERECCLLVLNLVSSTLCRSSWLRSPWLTPIRNSSELRGLCRRSYFGSRICGRGITNASKLAGLSIRVSPSHPYIGDL